MKRKIITISLIITILISGINIVSSYETSQIKYVDDDNILGPWDGTSEYPYQHIQDAIENASYNDMIHINTGIYSSENSIYINKTLTIVGNGSMLTNLTGCKIFVSAKNVSLSKMHVSNLFLKNATGCIIENITITTESDKPNIFLSNSNNNRICRNHIIPRKYGMYFEDCSNNVIDENVIGGNNFHWMTNGVCFWKGSNNTISRNNFTKIRYPITLTSTNNNKVKNNNIRDSKDGGASIELIKCNNTHISGNTIYNTSILGIDLDESHNNVITGNIIMGKRNNGAGIGIYDSNNNEISKNVIKNMKYWGISMYGNKNKIFSNDIINNGWSGIFLGEKSSYNKIKLNNVKQNGDINSTYSGGIRFHGKNKGNTVCFNNIVDNFNYGLNVSGGFVFASFNWWGTPLGPSKTKYALRGDIIVTKKAITFSFPWLLFPCKMNQ